MGDHLEFSARRLLVRAALLLVPLIALAAATPWLLEHVLPRRAHGAGDRPDRPPTDEEIRAARSADERLADAEKGWQRSTAIAPTGAVVDASGERVRWFQGFGVSVESVPAGAMVLVNGQERGDTPLTTSVECVPGQAVEVEVRPPGRAAQRRTTRCRQDQLVEITFELR